MHKIYLLRILFAISIIFLFFNVFWVLYQTSDRVESPAYLQDSAPVNVNDKIYINNDDGTILIHNYICGIFQCFDDNGDFLWGVHLPVTKNIESTLVSYNDGKYYFWTCKTNTVYVQEKGIIEIKETVDDKDAFYRLYPMISLQSNCKFNLNGSINTMQKKNIQLKTSYNFYSFSHAIIGIFLCGIVLVLAKKKLE